MDTRACMHAHAHAYSHTSNLWMNRKKTHWSYKFYNLAKMNIVYTPSSHYYRKNLKVPSGWWEPSFQLLWTILREVHLESGCNKKLSHKADTQMTYQRDFTFHEKKMCKSLREIKRNQVRMQTTAPKYVKALKILIFLVQKIYFVLCVWLFKRKSS